MCVNPLLLQERNVFAQSRPRKTRSPFKAVVNLYTHFVLEESLWEDEHDGCALVSFSSLAFLLSWSFSVSPYECSITKYTVINTVMQTKQKRLHGKVTTVIRLSATSIPHSRLTSTYTMCVSGWGGGWREADNLDLMRFVLRQISA